MKIIGKTESGFLLDASEDEVAKLLGFYSHYHSGCPPIKPGTEIKVSAMFDVAYERESQRRDLNEAIKKLRSVANYLEPIEAIAFPQEKKESQP